MRRMRTLIVTAALLGSCAAAAAAAAPPGEPDIPALHRAYAAHTATVESTEAHYESRIRAIDWSGPTLHSVLELNPDAPSIARALDRGAARDASHSPLFGVPVLLKDNIDTGDRMHTTAGSLALMGSKPAQDAPIVRRLRAAGAVILGKANLSEWANFRSRHSSSGWSARGGQTRNPFVLDRNPCGSSSGSAVAVAADLTVVAVATETDGSIVCPASINGIVGIKPTVGLVSRTGVIPISSSQDTPGPFARNVSDAALLLGVLAGYDPEDPATAPLKDHPPPDYRAALRTDALRGVRIGVLRESAGFNDEVDRSFDEALEALRHLGAELVDPVTIPSHGKLDDDEHTVLVYEFKDGIHRYLGTRSGPGPRDLSELIAFNATHPAQEMPWFGQDEFLDSQRSGPLTDQLYLEARERARRLAGAEGIDATLAKDHLDVLVAPTMGPAWLTDWINGDHFGGGDISQAPAVAGYPHITVPMRPVYGLPVGLSFVGTAWSEAKLIGYAYAYEQASHQRMTPHFTRRSGDP
jgi:amidase